jgi:site-specific DNA-methyltransferase (adenine-specific)
MENTLYYGDNMDVLQNHIPDESVDLCYIDPPFQSNRDYNQIYNNIGTEDRAQVTAFTDTWEWDMLADAALEQLLAGSNGKGLFYPIQCVDLVAGLLKVLKKGSMLAYLVYMALRINEIWRVLKPTGSFYLHCDHFANAYLRLLLDSIFLSQGGIFRNEIIWTYKSTLKVLKTHLGRDHDTIFFYSKSKNFVFHPDRKDYPVSPSTLKRWSKYADETGFVSNKHFAASKSARMNLHADPDKGFYIDRGIPRDVWDISIITGENKENQGFDTQKPQKLLERIIKQSSNEGDVVLDCYCGCGTTIEAAQKLGRKWIGIDITFNSIKIILNRLEREFGENLVKTIPLRGTPQDWESARALSLRPDDPTRKEFEKWAILTYANNRAAIRERKGKNYGIDGIATMSMGVDETRKIIFQVKSGKVSVRDLRELHSSVERENAAAGILITLYPPTKDMVDEARQAGTFANPITGHNVERLKIVTIEEMLKGERMRLPMIRDVYKPKL